MREVRLARVRTIPYWPQLAEPLGPDAPLLRGMIQQLVSEASEPEMVPAAYVSFAEASALTGIDKYRIGKVVKRAGVPVYRSPVDARKKFIKREDVGRLTEFVPMAVQP